MTELGFLQGSNSHYDYRPTTIMTEVTENSRQFVFFLFTFKDLTLDVDYSCV